MEDLFVDEDEYDRSHEEDDRRDDAEGFRTKQDKQSKHADPVDLHLHFLFILIFVVAQLVQVLTEEALGNEDVLELLDAAIGEDKGSD